MVYKVCGALSAVLLLSACGGGGSPAGGSTGTGSGGGSGSGGGTTYLAYNFVGAPAAASFGSNATPAITKDTVLGPNSTINLRLLQTAASSTSNGFRADTTVNASGATLTVDPSDVVKLFVPGLGLTNIVLDDDGNATLSGGRTLSMGVAGSGSAIFGAWSITQAGLPTNVAVFVTGIETKASDVPTTGSATYAGGSGSGVTTGYAVVDNKPYVLRYGFYQLDVNFASGAVSGAVTYVSAFGAEAGAPELRWNDVHLAGSIVAGDRRAITGTASAVAPATANASTLTSAATGSLTGRFFGPTADSVGAVWTLNDGLNAASGAFAGHR